MKIDRNKLIAFLWSITILFYLLRSIADPLKYLFVISFGTLLIGYSYFLILNFKRNSILKFLLATKEFQILGVVLASGIILSTETEILSIKSLVNYLGITILFLIYFEYKNHIPLFKLVKGWIFLTLLIGSIGLIKWLNHILEFNLDLFSVFYKNGSSLVSDYNIYASYFLSSIVIYFYALNKEIVQSKLIINQAFLFLFLANIVLTGSRRGMIVLAILILLSLIFLLLQRKKKHGILFINLACTNILVFSLLLIVLVLIPFRSKIIRDQSSRSNITASVFRYSTLFNPNITYSLLFDKLWPKNANYLYDKTDWDEYSTYNNLVDLEIQNEYQDLKNEYWLTFDENHNEENLFYNGSFQYGLSFWRSSAPDSIKHEIIRTEFGNAIRVSRMDGKGYWPLEYDGREIIYHEGATYTFRFKYRVIMGSGVPFHIGWWVNEGNGYKNNLPHQIRRLNSEWYEYEASYTFKENHYDVQTFLNSQQSNTIVDITNIELTRVDTLNRPKYLDQYRQVDGVNLFYNSNFENGLKFWGIDAPDLIQHELINTPFGKAVRVTRKVGEGYWQLVYQGRDIFYYKNKTYYFRFKYRVIKGESAPFYIGWWAVKEDPIPFNLQKDIYPLKDGWFECIASYTFKKDHYGELKTFVNNQQANTIIDFADIELICKDSSSRSMYSDENMDLIGILEESRFNQELGVRDKVLFSERTERWKYALELWTKEYNLPEKLFGGGFDYLEKFGQKFYPGEERIDYPHNPIISSFLYSGLLGGFFYIYFLALSFLYYWKYRKHHLLFFFIYLITFAFVFISSDSHFNVPVFAMLSLVPFITKYVVKEKEQKNPI